VIHGNEDVSIPPTWGVELARAVGGELILLDHTAHVPQGRKPVAVNLALREFGESVQATTDVVIEEVAVA
jgi:pimeloyl-ACP methyl ester carboxylesterase